MATMKPRDGSTYVWPRQKENEPYEEYQIRSLRDVIRHLSQNPDEDMGDLCRYKRDLEELT